MFSFKDTVAGGTIGILGVQDTVVTSGVDECDGVAAAAGEVVLDTWWWFFSTTGDSSVKKRISVN